MYRTFIKRNKEVIAGVLLLLGVVAAGAAITQENVIRFEDPENPDGRYIILYPVTGEFLIVQLVDTDPLTYVNETGSYTEYPDRYSLRGSFGVNLEAIKTENGIISGQTGREWVRV